MNKFYVYAHYNPIKKEIFYIGKGKGKRAYTNRRNNQHWRNIVNKYGYEVQFIATNLSEKEAKDLEITWISKIGRADKGLGSLVNHTDGGDGSSGYELTNEQKDNIGKAVKLRGSRSKETKDKISKKLKGRPLDETRKNKITKALFKGLSKVSETILSNRSNSEHHRTGIPSSNSRTIEQYDLGGQLVNIFPSITEAKLKTNISHINRALAKNKPVCGYIFKYRD